MPQTTNHSGYEPEITPAMVDAAERAFVEASYEGWDESLTQIRGVLEAVLRAAISAS